MKEQSSEESDEDKQQKTEIPGSQICGINIVKMIILSKVIYRVNQNLQNILHRHTKNIIRFIRNQKRARQLFKKKPFRRKNVGEIGVPVLQSYSNKKNMALVQKQTYRLKGDE